MISEDLKVARTLIRHCNYEEALEIYKILKKSYPQNKEIVAGYNLCFDLCFNTNKQMVKAFLSSDEKSKESFKRWLLQL